MKFAILSSAALLVAQASAIALPVDETALSVREAVATPEYDTLDSLTEYSPLEKRKGGGGRSGGSSGGSSSSSSSSGSSGGSSSGGRSSSSGSSGSGGTATGSRTSSPASFGRSGGAYRGGARSPYASGGRSPRGITPVFFLGGAALGIGLGAGALAYGAYNYDLDRANYYNQTAGARQSAAVKCYCARYDPCSCDRDDDEDGYVESLIGNGSYAAMQQNKVTKIRNNTLYIDGSLDNDTSASTAPTSAATGRQSTSEQAGWFALAAVVGVAVWAF